MKFVPIDPRSFFRRNKSGSDAASSASSSEYGSKKPNAGASTPTSVLPPAEWSSGEICAADGYFELKKAFEMIDRDGDGKIRKEEFEALLRRLGAEPPSQEELRIMDRDGDGCISLEEFQSSVGSAFAPPSCDAEMRETFSFFDANGDGRITAEELFSVLGRIAGAGRCTLEECRRMISGVDRNGDGFVCFEDFSRMMDHQRPR